MKSNNARERIRYLTADEIKRTANFLEMTYAMLKFRMENKGIYEQKIK